MFTYLLCDYIFCTVVRGRNEITRQSSASSVTIPHEVTYRNLDNNRPAANTDAAESFNICGCGWPENMLIPKGTTDGYQSQLFVMVTNDQVRRDNSNTRTFKTLCRRHRVSRGPCTTCATTRRIVEYFQHLGQPR